MILALLTGELPNETPFFQDLLELLTVIHVGSINIGNRFLDDEYHPQIFYCPGELYVRQDLVKVIHVVKEQSIVLADAGLPLFLPTLEVDQPPQGMLSMS